MSHLAAIGRAGRLANEGIESGDSTTKSSSWPLLILAFLSAIALAMVLQFLLIGLRSLLGAAPPKIIKIADLASGIAWGAMVGSALLLGIGALRSRARSMAIFGVIGAVSGFAVSGFIGMLIDPEHAVSFDPMRIETIAIAVIKAIEYGFLGHFLGRSIDRGSPSLQGNLQIGALIAAVFGGSVIALTVINASASLPLRTGLGLAINELLLPVGCAFVAYIVGQIVASSARRDLLLP